MNEGDIAKRRERQRAFVTKTAKPNENAVQREEQKEDPSNNSNKELEKYHLNWALFRQGWLDVGIT